jgi:hypothetical protein
MRGGRRLFTPVPEAVLLAGTLVYPDRGALVE